MFKSAQEVDTRPGTARDTAATAKWRMYTRYAILGVALIIALAAAYHYWPADEHKASEEAPPPQQTEQAMPPAQP